MNVDIILRRKRDWMLSWSKDVRTHLPKELRGLANKRFTNTPPEYLYPDVSALLYMEKVATATYSYSQMSTENQDRWRGDVDRQVRLGTALVDCAIPHYFLDPVLVQGLAQTDLPKDILYSELKQTIPAAFIHLPENSLVVSGESIAAFTFALVDDTPNRYDILVQVVSKHVTEKILLQMFRETSSYSEHSARMKGQYSGISAPFDMPVRETITKMLTNSPWVIETEDASIAIVKLVLNLLLYLQAVPEDFPPSPEKKLVRRLHPALPPPVETVPYQANIIGRLHSIEVAEKRKITRKESDTGRASPRMHWRRGHWRRVHSLEGLHPHWIQPTLVNSP